MVFSAASSTAWDFGRVNILLKEANSAASAILRWLVPLARFQQDHLKVTARFHGGKSDGVFAG
jgi:hypothetical protein